MAAPWGQRWVAPAATRMAPKPLRAFLGEPPRFGDRPPLGAVSCQLLSMAWSGSVPAPSWNCCPHCHPVTPLLLPRVLCIPFGKILPIYPRQEVKSECCRYSLGDSQEEEPFARPAPVLARLPDPRIVPRSCRSCSGAKAGSVPFPDLESQLELGFPPGPRHGSSCRQGWGVG